MAYGALGFVRKDSLPEDLLYAIQSVMRKRTYVDPYFMETQNPLLEIENILTNREVEVLECISKGYNNSKIAQKLFISVNTVKKHVGQLFSKLEVEDRTELVLLAADYFGGH